jgi:hypothetical protein
MVNSNVYLLTVYDGLPLSFDALKLNYLWLKYIYIWRKFTLKEIN